MWARCIDRRGDNRRCKKLVEWYPRNNKHKRKMTLEMKPEDIAEMSRSDILKGIGKGFY